jgi:hypothetical protein
VPLLPADEINGYLLFSTIPSFNPQGGYSFMLGADTSLSLPVRLLLAALLMVLLISTGYAGPPM